MKKIDKFMIIADCYKGIVATERQYFTDNDETFCIESKGIKVSFLDSEIKVSCIVDFFTYAEKALRIKKLANHLNVKIELKKINENLTLIKLS